MNPEHHTTFVGSVKQHPLSKDRGGAILSPDFSNRANGFVRLRKLHDIVIAEAHVLWRDALRRDTRRGASCHNMVSPDDEIAVLEIRAGRL